MSEAVSFLKYVFALWSESLCEKYLDAKHDKSVTTSILSLTKAPLYLNELIYGACCQYGNDILVSNVMIDIRLLFCLY